MHILFIAAIDAGIVITGMHVATNSIFKRIIFQKNVLTTYQYSCKVFLDSISSSVSGALVKANVKRSEAFNGLANGTYIVGDKKVVIMK